MSSFGRSWKSDPFLKAEWERAVERKNAAAYVAAKADKAQPVPVERRSGERRTDG